MNSSKRGFCVSGPAAARLSFLLSLGLTGAATLAAAPALYAQQRTDLAIQTDVVKALASYPDISNEHITATVKNGVVTLHGTASSNTAKSQAQVVAATIDGVTSVINNIGVTGHASAQPDSQDPADRNQAQPDQEPDQQPEQQPVQQAESADPNQQQAPYTPQAQPQPGTNGNWGQAGPPPDVQNGQIPQQPEGEQQNQNSEQDDQYPMQDPGEEPGQNQEQPPQQNQTGPPPQQEGAPYPQPGYPQRPPRPAYPSPYPGQYPGPYPERYPEQNHPYVAPNLSATPITIRPGTLFSVRISEPLDSHTLRGGENFQATLAQDIFEGQYLVIPRGAAVQGYVVGVKKPGALKGEAGFALQMTSLTLGGQHYPISTDTFASDTHGKGGYTTANTIGAAAIGALIGAAIGGGPGAAVGAVAGGVTGVGVSAASGPRQVMPPETLLNFHLTEPLTISPISLAEVQQLQASATPRPISRPRPPYPYPYYYGYPPPPPPPPPPGYYYYPYRY